MNREAERHLAKAAGYFERGEDFYRRAAAEIVAAREADPTLSDREVGEWFGRSREWARRIVTWATTSPPEGKIDWNRGSHGTAAEIRAGAEKLLASAPLEEVERIVGTLPPERQSAIAAAAGHGYHEARQRQQAADREREAREADEAPGARPVRQAVTDFASLGIVGHLEQATEELRELTADASLTPAAVRRIARAFDGFVEAFDFARALVGEEG